SGKDSAWALHEVRRSGDYEVVAAITTVTDTFKRVSMHGLREELLRAQLDAAGLSPKIVRIPFPCPHDVYERRKAQTLNAMKLIGVTHVIFRDLFLADIRAYREARLAENQHDTGFSALDEADRRLGVRDAGRGIECLACVR